MLGGGEGEGSEDGLLWSDMAKTLLSSTIKNPFNFYFIAANDLSYECATWGRRRYV